ncbi:trypsin-like peptidase domain-containing protein [Undibacterium macrobrachii]|uniref:trypsin-like peptidase domain-containing protein n=1 Tax=Undibacterium macrobrachii TaxID=1119058 RepID=UPI001674B1C8|nr:trypsin-like peptidase domain-containing protein [Undibacterium macrobrachii]
MTVPKSHLDSAKDLLKHWYGNIDDAIDKRRRSVAMVVRTVPGPRVEAFGTGFFYEKDGIPFFVTAKHVLDDMITSNQRGQRTILVTRGRKEFIDILKYEFFAQPELDIAVAPLLSESFSTYSHVEFWTANEIGSPLDLGLFAFTGFPASRNKTYTTQELKPYQRVITFDRTLVDSGIDSCFLEFPINSRELHSSALISMNLDFPEGISGMSGGPVFAVGGTIDQPLLSVCGMGVAWSNRCTLKILRFDVVDVWLSQYKIW